MQVLAEKLLADGLVPDQSAKRSRARADDLSGKVALGKKLLEINVKSSHAQLTAQRTALELVY